MVKVKVLENFRDRTAELALRKKGEDLEVSEKRAKELEKLGLVSIMKQKKENKDELEKSKNSDEKKG